MLVKTAATTEIARVTAKVDTMAITLVSLILTITNATNHNAIR